MGKLVRLELENFKSYKGHQVIHLGDGYFTSIVGPNGSGKSNSMDAISFVLGIKSSQLRSTHLRDLIYRGRKLRSDPRNGESQTQATQDSDPKSAYVMAVYIEDAGDEQIEHRWKRIITSSGASEYRINEKQVTAAQYNAALEKQEILIKARNFLIFQGEVEAIASQSPRDLTRLIEQISGSLEYKAEYEKLKAQEVAAAETSAFNLNRRRGINAEIKQYQEQKKEAENYQAKVEERDDAIVTHVLWKLFHFQETMEQNKAEIEKHQEELREFNRANEKYSRRVDDAKTEHAKATKSVAKQEREIKRKEKELEARESSLVPIDEKISIASDNLKRFANRIKEITRDKESQSSTVRSLEKDLAVVQKAQKKFEDEQKKAAEAVGAVLSEADLAEYNKLKEQVNTQVASQQISIDDLTRQEKTEAESADTLKSKIESAQWQLGKLQTEVTELKDRQEEFDTQLTSVNKDIEKKKKEYNAVTSERVRNEQKNTELNEKLHDCLQKLAEADDGRRASHRETQSKERAMTLKRIFPGVKGRVSELCKPKQKKYHEAVSTVLGRNWEAIVVDNEDTAKQCIEYLRDQRSGQATFLPLDTIQVKPLNSSLKGMHRAMRMAIDTIEFESSVERAMLYACGNAVVCDDLKTAKYICYEKQIEVKAVTLDGTVIHKGGLMTGGRVGNGGGRRFEDQEVEALRRLQENLLAQIAALPKGRQGLAREEALKGELSGLAEQAKYRQMELTHLQRTLDSKHKELKHTEREIATLQPKLDAATASLTSLRSKLSSLQQVVSDAEDTVFRTFCQRLGLDNIRTYEKQQGSLQQEMARRALDFTRQRSKIENSLVFERERLEKTTKRIEDLKSKADRDQSLVSELEEEKQAIKEAMDELEAELELMREELDTRKSKLEERAQHVATQKRELQKVLSGLEETRRAVSTLESENERLAANRYSILRRCKLEEIQLPLTDDSAPLDTLPIDDTLSLPDPDDPDAMDLDPAPSPSAHAYNIHPSFTSLPPSLTAPTTPQESSTLESTLLDKIKTLTSELSRMAPNMKAISRLSGVETRLASTAAEFEASKQHAKAAKDAFLAVKTKRYTLFKKAFDHIRSQIDHIYKELTATPPSLLAAISGGGAGGQGAGMATMLAGTAYLDLEDSEEPYLDGIKYHVQPPTKRFRDMEQLSGGEKTMAALALLFAIHSYQPSPFFVLDEVDAALDAANVVRVREYVRRNKGDASGGVGIRGDGRRGEEGGNNGSGGGGQFIVISLKTGLWEGSEQVVGVYRDQVECSSRCLTLDLTKYREDELAIR
ncbi:RecF/RecN/SMC protein [Ascodesmis nigricans]|uniref:Structural maintenance of chromosomes protein n=1 Tax=Ascodesmis nigricans TaxID=341454 RepID=A0A4S2MTW9_9PEZI|nr:RecF/RecN/SMC protein [Ascodesmis nigricans]